MKKIHLFQIISVTSLILLGGPLANAASFSDVSGNHLNSDAIEYVQENGIVSGYPDGTFKPDNTINRAEFTKIIVGAQFDAAIIENCITQNVQAGWTYVFFPDVPKDAWFAKYICVAKMHDIIKGYSDGTFGPAKDINFAEAAKIIVNTFGYTVVTDEIWYKPFVEKLGEKKSIPTTIISFSKNITRGEMAEMVYRLKTDVVTKESLDYETIATQAELPTYQNEEYGYSVSYPKDWYYKETGGTYFSQATGFNPNGVGAEDYQAMVAVLSVDRQTYLNSLDDNSNLKIVREYGVLIDNQLGAKYTYQNISTDSTFSIYILTFNDTNYLITADESVEDTFVGSFAIQAELLTYQNDVYGFEFQYPKEWKIDQARTSTNEIVFDIGISESREAVAFAKNTQNKTLEQLKADQVPDTSVIDKQSEITIGGEMALVIETTEMGRTLILFNHGANTYAITTGGRRMIDEGVTSTFKFTD